MLWPDPAQRGRLAEIRDNLTARIAEGRREGWAGEVEGLQVSLAGAEQKLAQIDWRNQSRTVVDLGIFTNPGGDRWTRLQDGALDMFLAHHATPRRETAQYPPKGR